MTMLAISLIAGVLSVGPASSLATDVTEVSEPPAVEPGLNFSDEIAKREREPLQTRFDEALEAACKPPPCTANCKDDESSIGVEISRDDRDYELNWVLRDPRLDQPLPRNTNCELCSLVELEDQLATDVGALCTRLSALDGSPARLRVTSDPSGATVRVDGRKVGKTPWSGELEAGEHVVQIDMRGFEDETRTLELVNGTDESLEVSLMSEAPIGDAIVRRPLWPGWTGIGVGVALAIAGTALIALDNKDYRGDCTGENVDAYGNCRFAYRTIGLGAGLAVLGAASFGTGVGLMIRAQKGHFTAGVGISGRF